MPTKHVLPLLSALLIIIFSSVQSAAAQTPPASPATEVASEATSEDEATSEQSDSEDTPNESERIDLGIGELLNSEALSDTWLESVNDSLAALGLPENNIGSVLATILVLLAGVILWLIARKTLLFLLGRLLNTSPFITATGKRSAIYQKLINVGVFVIFLCLAIMSVCNIWITDTESSIIYNQTFGFFRFFVTLIFLITLAAIVYEIIRSLLEHVFKKWSRTSSPRVNTLLPIARNVVNITLFTIFGITIISELGINIMPLLAGAGVLGFAVGFGAQTFIKDLLTGFIIIFEDLVQVGDVVTVGGKSGLVEKITVRKMQLRSLDGIAITVPFSEISIVENMTKEYSYYLMNVGVAYRENPDQVIEVLRSLSDELLGDENYASDILEPIEILGVDEFADSAVIIKARIKTKPIKQWAIGREFNRRMKHRFDKENIEIPFPHQTVYFGEHKSGEVTKARFDIAQLPSESESADGGDEDRSERRSHKTAKKPRTDRPENVESDEGDQD